MLSNSPHCLTNKVLPSTYDSPLIKGHYLNKYIFHNKSSNCISAPTSLKLNSDLNLLEYQNKILLNNQKNDIHSQNYLYYISQKKTQNTNLKRISVNQDNINQYVKDYYHQYNQYKNNYQNKSIPKILENQKLSNRINLNFPLGQNRYDYSKFGPKESMEERQKKYFYHKQVLDNDYQRLTYLDYLQGKIDHVTPNPYNKHRDYLGESSIKNNTIINPTNNYLGNKYLFKEKYADHLLKNLGKYIMVK